MTDDDPIGPPAAPDSSPEPGPPAGAIVPGTPRPSSHESSAVAGFGAVPPWMVSGVEAAPPATSPDTASEPSSPSPLDADTEVDKPTRAIDRQLRTILEWVAVAVGALAVALIIKTFLLQAFYIPSGSMESTLMRGDRVLVNKLSYDLHDVNRGDVIVFEKPPGEGGEIEDLIKRVIALPGETVAFQDGSIYIDGFLLEEPYLDADVPSLAKTAIPNCENPPAIDSCLIPVDRVFVMGDNREESRDSRFFGPIAENSIVGRAFLKVWPLADVGFL